MRIGYARVTTQDQDNTAQIAALNAAGCGWIFEEKVSAGRWNRPELSRLLDHLRKDDVLVVWKLDRLSRSLICIWPLTTTACFGASLREQSRSVEADLLDAASPHWLCHTFAKTALLKGVELRVVAQSLGHANIATTMGYTVQDALDQIREYERADRAMVVSVGGS